ncbi:hypothetical protein Pcar_3359 [Syntrophotalea carbinolica DSM 2380]|uniref:Uncharacterized protein n=1 Tax=Syntrophotalea carbinolica (strain DSM 2380 / NBRC 103641 / GraBd1) TaxID=338963 RepID=Q0C6G4_SYNC1|nr:hypothetical protein Pcar_3359 [Syntrophotalea carbinolica DSM 2380]
MEKNNDNQEVVFPNIAIFSASPPFVPVQQRQIRQNIPLRKAPKSDSENTVYTQLTISQKHNSGQQNIYPKKGLSITGNPMTYRVSSRT